MHPDQKRRNERRERGWCGNPECMQEHAHSGPCAPRDDLADLHARWHDMPGNLMYAEDCGYERCEFWHIGLFVTRPEPAGVSSERF